MLSLGCERLPTPLKKKKKVLDHYLHHDLGMLPLLRCFFAHLLILQYPDHHQNLISSYLYYSGPIHKISSQFVHNFLSNVVHRQTDRQTNQRYQKHNLLCQGGNEQLYEGTMNCYVTCSVFSCSLGKIPMVRCKWYFLINDKKSLYQVQIEADDHTFHCCLIKPILYCFSQMKLPWGIA